VAHTFRRALKRAGITTGDVSLQTLRHTAIRRMIDCDGDWRFHSNGHLGPSVSADAGALYPSDDPPGSWTRWRSTWMGRIREELKQAPKKTLVDGARLELATSALRTRRSPNWA